MTKLKNQEVKRTAAPHDRGQQDASHNQEMNLKGTFIAVMLLGVFILATWFGCYYLFISR